MFPTAYRNPASVCRACRRSTSGVIDRQPWQQASSRLRLGAIAIAIAIAIVVARVEDAGMVGSSGRHKRPMPRPGNCPFKSGTLPTPIPIGEDCCIGEGCELCGLGECLIPSNIGSEGYCPWPVNPGDPPVIEPLQACTRRDKCRFGDCILFGGGDPLGFCPTMGEAKPPLGPGQPCCIGEDCTDCQKPYFCKILSVIDPFELPTGECLFDRGDRLAGGRGGDSED